MIKTAIAKTIASKAINS